MGDEDPVGAYDQLGRDLRNLIESLLPDDWSWDGKRVLDFGCGAGRVLRHFASESDRAEFWGCDIDRRSVAWMEENLSPPFHVFACQEMPGLPQSDATFDLIYAISVYTHLTDDWAGWLLEHHRVLTDGGLLFATFLGEGMIGPLTGETWDEAKIGMNPLLYGSPWEKGGPITLNSPWWIRAHWGRAFDILELKPSSADDPSSGHGIVIARKKQVDLTIADLQALEPDEPREISALQHHAWQLRNETLQLRGVIQRLQDERDRQSGEARASTDDLAVYREQLRKIEGSRSWRLTAPLRDAGRLVRKRR